MRKTGILPVLLMVVVLILSACNGEAMNETSAQSNGTSFPERDLKIIVPFAPGGAVDTISRIIAKHGEEHTDGKNIIVENKEGGGAVIGQTFVAKAKPDGYTLLAFTSSVVSNPMTTETAYTHEDFTPIVMYSFEPELLVVAKDSEFDTFEDFEKKAKESKVSLTTPGHSTSHHTAGILLEENSGWNFDYIHTGSGGEQLQQLLGGHVEAALMTYGEVQSQIKEGTIRAIGVMNEERLESLPDVPTFKESGIDLVYGPFRGLAVPKDTPDDVVDKLEKMYSDILKDEEFVKDMNGKGFEVVYGDSTELQKKVEAEAEFINLVLPLIKK